MKNFVVIVAITLTPAANSTVFESSQSDLYYTYIDCDFGNSVNVSFYGKNTRPTHIGDGTVIVSGRTNCLPSNEVIINGRNAKIYKYVWWAGRYGNRTVRYSEWTSAPPPLPSKPSTWQSVVQVDPVVVGTYRDITVPLTEHETRTYEYAARVQEQACVNIVTPGVVSGRNPLSVRIRGRSPCTFHAVISITATLK